LICKTICLVNSYTDGASKTDANADPSAMGQMDPAWIAYYQSMSYYNMMQSAMTTSSTTSTTTTKTTDSTANTTDSNSTTAGLFFQTLKS